MHEPERNRLHALIEAIGAPAVVHARVDGDEAAGEAAQRVATPQIDALLRRVTALTALLEGGNDAQWDEIDQLAARLLMSDLAAITALTRALNGLSASRLAEALAALTSAGQDAERVLQSSAEPGFSRM
jgi:hypothetical protein